MCIRDSHIHQSSGALDNWTRSYWTGTRDSSSVDDDDDDADWLGSRWIKRQIHLPSGRRRRLRLCSDIQQDRCGRQPTTSDNDQRTVKYSTSSQHSHLHPTVDDRGSSMVVINSRIDPHNVCFGRPRPRRGSISNSVVADDGAGGMQCRVQSACNEIVYRTQTDPTVRVEFTTDNNGNLVKVFHLFTYINNTTAWQWHRAFATEMRPIAYHSRAAQSCSDGQL